MATVSEIQASAEARMGKSLESLKADLTKLRTGRANVALLDHLKVEYYGNPTPLNQVANVAVGDARTLTVTPFEKSMVQAVEKAILESDLGLNPATAGQTIRIPMPALTEERRKELAKLAKSEGENAKIALRNIRRDANHQLKEQLKNKEISEDDDKRAEELIQKITDKNVSEVDKIVAEKEKDIMEI